MSFSYEELLEMSQSDLAEQVRYLQRKLTEARQQETLRDKFAGRAMEGCLMAILHSQHGQRIEGLADTAYKIADAMLIARNRKETDES